MAGLIIAPRARIFHGHEWVYATEVKKTFGDPQPGDVITLKDFQDRSLGTAIYNPMSQIVARRFSRRKQDLDAEFFVRRIGQSIEHRQRLGLDETLARLVWSESDGMPGLIIDRYGAHVVVQALTLAMRQRVELIVAALKELISPETIILRNDSPVLKAEGIEQEITVLHGTNPGAFIVEANGLQFEIDLLDGQKTGLYLDQLQSHAEVAKMAEGKRVLDCFTNQGGFALACAKAGAAKVTAVDISESACAAARRNAELNGLELDVIAHNVFDFLKHGTPDYDFIILDPPSFTRNKKTLMDAMRGYKEIHLRSLKLLDKGGLLSTFCCSHHANRELFQANLVDAAVDAKKSLRLVMNHGQRADHPVLLALPETEYLKGITAELMAGR
ncbi:MAG: rRNA large subunit methyltransferase I [Verrucomicrobiia bacterium Tous-C4TDCM]|jgi:23S rRNA (cytosine1962-C5)-methyltransferase|nr:MAG: rRNA large subunit methyltransferase I [Verrucomicrobiae bacterium Tous-C4TDCM]